MQNQASVRSLASLKDAASARVLNLLAIERAHGQTEDYRKRPFFDSPVLNSAILLKHRLRPDDHFLFVEETQNATKIILPFDKVDLRLGGTSFFYGQRGYVEFVREFGNYGNNSMDRDLKVLQILDSLPSLDPFLVHERLRLDNVFVADCYFDLSTSDKRKMHDFVTQEIQSLVKLAYRRETNASREGEVASSERLASAILAVAAEEQLEPLRGSLMLRGDEFRKGIFCWRGFLYYKWRLIDLLPRIKQVFREIAELPVISSDRDSDAMTVRNYKRHLGRLIASVSQKLNQSIALYDKQYGELVTGGDPELFRNFLLSAPQMFLELGERFGGLAHIESFWRYRFPKKQIRPVRADEAMLLLVDFAASVGVHEEEFA